MTGGRTITLEDTTLLVSEIRAWRVDAFGSESGQNPFNTTVWLSAMPHPFSIRGDHCDALTAAVEGRS
jgi:hypothetical protein